MPDLTGMTELVSTLKNAGWLLPLGWLATLVLLSIVVMILKHLEQRDHRRLRHLTYQHAAAERRRAMRAPKPPLARHGRLPQDSGWRSDDDASLLTLAASRRAGSRQSAPRPADDLKRIRGIGSLIEQRLNDLGVTHYQQIAAWDPVEMARINRALGQRERIEREGWIGQARILASGRSTEYARRIDEGTQRIATPRSLPSLLPA